jgi:hypothetical protein
MIGHSTLTELRLRQAQLEDSAQRLRDRAHGMDPTRAATAAVCRKVRATQKRADEYAAILSLLAGPTLEEMERDVVTVLTCPEQMPGTPDLGPGLSRAQRLMGSLFENWRSRR